MASEVYDRECRTPHGFAPKSYDRLTCKRCGLPPWEHFVIELEDGTKGVARPLMDGAWIVQSPNADACGNDWRIIDWAQLRDLPARPLRKDEVM